MDESSYKDQFESLTRGMAVEKIYDRLADRAELVRVMTMHCGEIYRTARKAGLPRKVAAGMAREYFSYEMTPSGYYVVGSGE
ncbi:hypothetical protein ABZ353_10925 [Streptomyces niveus]|uniref:hypothetical protein n=1 Tax=Streptomyces niveus TaxID=193462 RepID=UPI0033DAE5FC